MAKCIKSLSLLVSGLVIAVTGIVTPSFVSAAPAHPKTVQANPANFTPQLPIAASTAIYSFAQVGSTMYAGGQFTSIGGVTRTNIAAFDATTGVIAPFSANVNGQVWSIVPDTDGNLIISGTFTTVNGSARRGLAKVTTAGVLVPEFNANLNGSVFDAELISGRLIVAGNFTKRLAAVSPVSGAETGYISIPISGTTATNAGATDVYRFSVNPQNSKLVAIGNFTTVGGQSRTRAFMLDLGATATLSSWYYKPLEKMCAASSIPAYLRDVDFSPDGTYFVFVSTGYVPLSGDIGTTLCDATARFETSNNAPVTPTWINYTGGDTLHSVAVTGAAVYVGGHQRWLDNAQGRDSCGTGCVARQGIGAIHPTTGKALSWNPMRTRGIGAKELYVTSAGLWVGSDTGNGGKLGCSAPAGPNLDNCAGKVLENHAGIGFLPL